MKKYLRLACSVCKRTVDRQVDNTRFAPDKCNITLKCQGRLLPVEYRSDGQIATSPEIGITDWYPRGTQATATTDAVPASFIDTSTGELQQLVLAVRLDAEPATGSTVAVTMETLAETPKAYKSFVFQRSSEFSTISGVESGVSQKTLKFKTWGSEPDQVSVLLNGVKLQEGTGPQDYQVDDGSPNPPAPSNTIKFNSAVLPVGTFQVEVIVSKAVAAITQTVIFNRNADNESRLSLGAWENVSHIERFSDVAGLQRFYLFTFDVKSNAVLSRDTILFPTGNVFLSSGATSQIVSLSNCFFAMSRKPHLKVDRYPDISVYLSDLDPQRDYLKYAAVDGQLALSVTSTSLTTNFPPSSVVRFNPEGTIKVQVAGETEQIVVDGSVVVGPDV